MEITLFKFELPLEKPHLKGNVLKSSLTLPMLKNGSFYLEITHSQCENLLVSELLVLPL
jgi:hypothetical protein